MAILRIVLKFQIQTPLCGSEVQPEVSFQLSTLCTQQLLRQRVQQCFETVPRNCPRSHWSHQCPFPSPQPWPWQERATDLWDVSGSRYTRQSHRRLETGVPRSLCCLISISSSDTPTGQTRVLRAQIESRPGIEVKEIRKSP